jgi:cellulose synthase/poly-beta-1,6-N-acetylglucosamine synthase-like glycosyltransferase
MPISLLFLTVPLLYATFVVYFIILLLKKHKAVPFNTTAQKLPGISIVIPFRNEADNFSRLIDSLDAQTYAGDFEIVLVNDGSTDHYNQTIVSHPRSRNRPLPLLRVIDAHYSPACYLTSKQQALDYGIKEAKHEWIALTDADMYLSPSWLDMLIKPAVGGAKLVFGHTAIFAERKKSFFAWFQSFQLETLFSFAYALHRAGISGSCMGNNMLLSREAFIDIGGFESIGYSIVEDRDLLAMFRRKNIPVTATDPFFPTAFTMPCEKVTTYFHQLLRWVRGGFRKPSVLSLLGILLLAHTAFFLITGTGEFSLTLRNAVMANQLLTWLFISIAFKRIGTTISPLLFPFFFVIFLIEAFSISLALIGKKRIQWKGRKI